MTLQMHVMKEKKRKETSLILISCQNFSPGEALRVETPNVSVQNEFECS